MPKPKHKRGQAWVGFGSTPMRRHPPHLKGRDIGLYYKNLQTNRNKEETSKMITFRLPSAIAYKVSLKLESIAKIAEILKKEPDCQLKTDDSDVIAIDSDDGTSADVIKKEPIEWCLNSEIQNTKDIDTKWSPKSETDDTESQRSETVFKLPNPVSVKQEFKDSPGSSSTPDFIPISTNEPIPGDSSDKQLSFRGGGDYKYGYNDIITGTFDEKLEECVLKGVCIDKSTEEIKKISQALQEEYIVMQQKSGYRRMLKFRERLPTYEKSQELLNIVNNNQVVVISGETGCGKSTQVPQIILDHAICNNRGGNVKILVTQPRRIAASSLAARVAEERGETPGKSVGYAVRLERIDARERGSIFFCTTGVLLAELEVNQGLTKYSHIILDEVHERDCHIDLSMCMLKRVLTKRKNLKLILMSATLDAATLSEYFDNCPMLHIEGLAYPVQDIYLEDILKMTRFQLPPMLTSPWGRNQPKWVSHKNRGKNVAEAMEREIQHRAEIGPWLESIKRNINREVYRTLLDPRSEDLNMDLICELLINICNGEPGAILVFLPGIGEITKLLRIMEDTKMFPNSRCEIYPLHSKLPSLEQHKIFERPPNHIRKIIIATNIAETSITIDDVVYVIDCGKIKMSGLNVEENLSTLKIEWISQANLRQRRGRAGRCQPGICYHMLTSYRAGKLEERLLPELQRSNLLEPVLTIKRLRLGKAVDALNLVPSPPAESTVKWAVKHLQQCGALDDNETLTPLGWHLARLPVHPSAGKLLLLGALFGCLDRAASVAAVWGFKDPFQLVIGKEREADKAKRLLALGEPSDHIAISEAIMQWEQCSRNDQRSFAYDHFLSHKTLELLSEMKNQLGDSLKQMGFLSSSNVRSSWENRNSYNLSLFKAIVAASLYPNIATVRWNFTNHIKRTKQLRIKVHTPDMNRPVSVHPSSVMVPPKFLKRGETMPLCSNPGANWLVYWLKQKSSDLFLIEVTLVYTLPLLFFGELQVTVEKDETNENKCLMSISSYKVRCQKETADMLFQLRSLLDQVLASKVMVSREHSVRQNDFEQLVLNAVIELITAEDEGAEYLGDPDSHSESDVSDYESNSSWR